MHLIDNEYPVFADRGGNVDLLGDVADIIDRVVGCRVELDYIE